jgi:pimeloyl-ACP methyl ester carboxylesterase
MESKIIETYLGSIEYTIEGNGITILVVHGGNDNCFADIRQESLLQAGYQVLIPSRPGYGKTTLALGKSASEQADVLKTLLDALNIQKTAVIGASAGGATALEFARKYPEATYCLILEEAVTTTWISKYSPQYWAMKWVFNPNRQAKLWRQQREQFDCDPKASLVALAKMFSRCKPMDVVNQWDAEDIRYYRKLLQFSDSGSGFVYTMDHKAKNLQDIHIPVLIIHSPHDRNVPFHHAKYAYRQIRNAELYEAPSLSHLIYMGKGKDDVTNKRMEFLKRTIG